MQASRNQTAVRDGLADRARSNRACGPVLLLGLAYLAALTACKRHPASDGETVVAAAVGQSNSAGTSLAYSHDVSIDLPADRVAPHFAAARDRCLTDASLHCVLLEAAIERGGQGGAHPRATLRVRLPHAAVAIYEAVLATAQPGERPQDVRVVSQATRAEDLRRPIEDTKRRLAQLTDYRDRLTVLAGRQDTRVDDLIKIAGELSRAQAQLESAETDQRGLQVRVDTELLAVTFASAAGLGGVWAPVIETWREGGPLLGESAGNALRFAILALPWLPIVVIALALLRWIWSRRRRPRQF